MGDDNRSDGLSAASEEIKRRQLELDKQRNKQNQSLQQRQLSLIARMQSAVPTAPNALDKAVAAGQVQGSAQDLARTSLASRLGG